MSLNLADVANHPDPTVRELAEAAASDPEVLQVLADRLEELGLLEYARRARERYDYTPASNVASITVFGRRWFQRTYGNTYHTADIYINGNLLHTTPETYGYGQQYVYTAFAWLRDSGILPDWDRQAPFHYCEERGITLNYEVEDVPRRRDL
jgi:hypothetical protein